MNDLILVGNMSVDKILRTDNNNKILHSELRVGGIANVAKTLTQENVAWDMYSTLGDDCWAPWVHVLYPRIESKPGKTSEVLILQKPTGSEHYIDWQNCKRLTRLPKRTAKWCHIAYLDNLDTIGIEDIKWAAGEYGVLSADLCYDGQIAQSNTSDMLEKSKYLDILFMCSKCFYSSYIQQFQAKYIISHNPQHVSIYEDQKFIYQIRTKHEESWTDVVGAGDTLAAHIIKHMKLPTEDIVRQAISETYRDLKARHV